MAGTTQQSRAGLHSRVSRRNGVNLCNRLRIARSTRQAKWERRVYFTFKSFGSRLGEVRVVRGRELQVIRRSAGCPRNELNHVAETLVKRTHRRTYPVIQQRLYESHVECV